LQGDEVLMFGIWEGLRVQRVKQAARDKLGDLAAMSKVKGRCSSCPAPTFPESVLCEAFDHIAAHGYENRSKSRELRSPNHFVLLNFYLLYLTVYLLCKFILNLSSA
jgi:hypothetical protein